MKASHPSVNPSNKLERVSHELIKSGSSVSLLITFLDSGKRMRIHLERGEAEEIAEALDKPKGNVLRRLFKQG